MNFKIFGTNIYVSFLFTAVVTIMLATDRTGLMLPTLFAIIMHEAGHLFAMWVMDCSPKQVKLIPASIQITSEFSKRYRNDIVIAFCGPVTNLVLFLVMYFNYLAFKNEAVQYFALLNLLVCGFNLMPVTGLDGGTILFSILAKKLEYFKAKMILSIITLSVAIAVLIVAITMSIRGNINLSLYIVALYLLVMTFLKR